MTSSSDSVPAGSNQPENPHPKRYIVQELDGSCVERDHPLHRAWADGFAAARVSSRDELPGAREGVGERDGRSGRGQPSGDGAEPSVLPGTGQGVSSRDETVREIVECLRAEGDPSLAGGYQDAADLIVQRYGGEA